jgi:hypothetical protein
MRLATPAVALRHGGLMKFLFSLLLLVALGSGCSTATTRRIGSLEKIHRVFVEQRLNDNNRIDVLLAAELRKLGLEAASGPRTMMPAGTDAVLTYDARWTWDFKTYLIELNVALHTAITDQPLATGRYYQPSIRTKPPERVIHELLAPWFSK